MDIEEMDRKELDKAIGEFNAFKDAGYGNYYLPSSGSIEISINAMKDRRDKLDRSMCHRCRNRGYYCKECKRTSELADYYDPR